jgi:hypothetical protein
LEIIKAIKKITIFFRIMPFNYTCPSFVDKKERIFFTNLEMSVDFYFLSPIYNGAIALLDMLKQPGSEWQMLRSSAKV